MTDQHPIVFLDTETTGLHADRRPWEIAWIRREIDGTETERLLQIRDVDRADAELKGLQVGGFHDRWYGMQVWPFDRRDVPIREGDPTQFVGEYEAALELERVTCGAIIIGAVPNFDTETLAAMLRRYELCPAWHYQLVDIETLAAGWLQARPERAPKVAELNALKPELAEKEVLQAQLHKYSPDSWSRTNTDEAVVLLQSRVYDLELELSSLTAPPWRSDDLSLACGVEPPTPEERHTALGDARWVKRWYDHITGTGE